MNFRIDVYHHFPKSHCDTDSLKLISIFLKEYSEDMSQAIDNLKTAVDSDLDVDTQGLTDMNSAFDELVTDLQGLPNADDVNTQAGRVAANASTMRDAFAAFSTKLRDLVPTAAASTGTDNTGVAGSGVANPADTEG